MVGEREYDMTKATFHRRPTSTRQARPKTGRTHVNSVDVIAACAMVLRPVVVSVAVIAAAMTWTAPAHADPIGDSITTVLNSIGIGNSGPISTAIAQVGQSICPLLVQPGSNFASNATQLSGNGGLAPPIAGFLTGMAIQTECPAFITSIANGNLTGAISPPVPFSLPGASPPPIPVQLPGMNPPAPSPLQFPGL
jgi:hypothetical protein